MSDCREVILGVAAQWWFESWMQDYYLPSLVSQHVDFERGTFSTWMPGDVPDEAAQCFETGFWSQSKMYDSRERIWVFEESLGSPSDEWFIKNPAGHIVPSATHIYYVLSNGMSAPVMARTLRSCLTQLPSMIGVFTAFRAEDIGRHMTNDTLAAVARGVQALVIGAYDGEGFVTWRPRGGES